MVRILLKTIYIKKKQQKNNVERHFADLSGN